jgi:3-hydroxyacyl-CoA dehydrogenase/enoyl-CoA hydratase/3-hydroxybutyryl-CoA epimerase
MEFFNLERHEDGILFAFIDNPRDRMNTLSTPMIAELEDLLGKAEGDHSTKALVFISAKPDNFIVGADIKTFDEVTEPEQIREVLIRIQAIFSRIANLPFPAIAAINGPCLGGGLELALACHFRIATDWSKTVLGLPEIRLGLFPAAGGTQRLTRLAGVQKALPLMLTGKALTPAQAKALRIVDLVVFPGDLPGTVKRCMPYFSKRFPRKFSYPPAFSLDRLLRAVTPVRNLYFDMVRRSVTRSTGLNYPAPFRLIDCVAAGIAGTMSDGFKAEAESFGPLVVSQQSRSLRHLFFAQTGLKKRSYGAQAKPVDVVGVLGSGFMGTGIAAVSAENGYRVALQDVSRENLSKSLHQIWSHLDKKIRRQRRNPVQRDRLFSQVVPAHDYAQLARAGLVIEAVFEDLRIKQEVLREVERTVSPECIFASNTSAIPISQIAAASSRPGNVIGMHYFSPVARMPLLEVVVPEQCEDWVVSTAVSVGRRQGKTVIVVKDGPGFYTTRILMPFTLEAIRLLEEGARIEDVDSALQTFGFPVGPLKLLDEVGLDVAAHVARELDDFFSQRLSHGPEVLEVMVKAGYEGKKKGAGFYSYKPGLFQRIIPGHDRARAADRRVYGFFGGGRRRRMEPSLIQKRLVFLMINEAALCLQDGTISGPEDGDTGAVFGLGFPPFLGGPFFYLDSFGIDKFVSEMEDFATRLGSRFVPAPILVHMAQLAEHFYGRS